jgi:hypothetical protein
MVRPAGPVPSSDYPGAHRDGETILRVKWAHSWPLYRGLVLSPEILNGGAMDKE